MEITPDNSYQAESLGIYLKNLRLAKKLSLKQISERTRINLKILENLEADNFEDLPKEPYVRGFVKNYLKIVGGDQEQGLVIFNACYRAPNLDVISEQPNIYNAPLKSDLPEVGASVKEIESSINGSLTTFLKEHKKFLLTILATLIATVLIWQVVAFLLQSVKQTSSEIVKTEILENRQNEIKDANQPLFDSEKIQSLRNQIESEEPQIEKNNIKKEKTTEPESKATPIIEVTSTDTEKAPADKQVILKKKNQSAKRVYPDVNFNKINKPLFTVAEQSQQELNQQFLTQTFRSQFQEDKQNILIVAVDGDTWLSYKTDTHEIKKFVLKQGQKLFVQGDTIRLFLGNVNIARIFYQNKLINTPTRTGVKSLIFPEEAQKDFELPLFVNDANNVLHSGDQYKVLMLEEQNSSPEN